MGQCIIRARSIRESAILVAAATAMATLLSACAGTSVGGLTTSTLTTATVPDRPAAVAPVRGTPIVVGRSSRVYIMVGFKEDTCAPVPADLSVVTPPQKGVVSFKSNQMTTLQFSQSGKCVGRQLPGVGVYYTAHAGQTGPDTFTISAATGSGTPATRTFNVRVVE